MLGHMLGFLLINSREARLDDLSRRLPPLQY
jgi:hypothetical protein